MRNLWQLLKINLLSFYGINKIKHSKDIEEKQKNKRQLLIVAIGFVAILYMAFYYGAMMMDAFIPMKAEHLLLAMGLVSTSIFTLYTMIYKTNGFLFRFKDYDMIASLPIKNSIVIISRIILLYIMSMIYTLLFMIPIGVIYIIKINPEFNFYIIYLLTLLVLPLIPIIIGVIIGSIITLISSKFKKKNIVNLILTLAFFVGVIYISYSGAGDKAAIYNLVDSFMSTLNSKYPFVNMYVEGLVDYNIIEVIKFVGISLGLFFLFVLIVSKYFNKINTFLSSNKNTSKYKEKKLKESSIQKTLLKKEFKRYFSSTNYVLNTSIGLVLLTICSVLTVIFGSDTLESLIEIEGFSKMLINYAPLVLSVFVSMSCTTNCTISLEGKNFWILKTLPIEEIKIINAKLLMNIIISFIAITINATILNIYLKSNWMFVIFMYLIPILYSVLISQIGIILNLYSNSFDWKNEIIVIKQSLPSLISIFLGLGLSILPIVITSNVDIIPELILLIVAVSLFIINFIMYMFLNKKGTKILKEITYN